MKIAITAKGKTFESDVDSRFGRAENFILIDSDTESIDIVDNVQNLNAAQGAGIQAAQTIVNSGAQCLITGHCGPKAFTVLSAANVSIYTGASGTVRDAWEAYKKGALTKSASADVEGHW